MSAYKTVSRRWGAVFAVSALLLLSACGNNQYGPPVSGQSLTWGQKHYLDNQRYQQLNNDRIN